MSNPSLNVWVLLTRVLFTLRLVYFNQRHWQWPSEFSRLLYHISLGRCCKMGMLISVQLLGLLGEVLRHQGACPDPAAPKNARDVVAQWPELSGIPQFWVSPPWLPSGELGAQGWSESVPSI